MKKIVITGSIATGKSTVSNYLRQLGYSVIDFDLLARVVVEPGSSGLSQLCQCFGSNILTEEETLNRPYLGQLIFQDVEKRQQVNAILHPLILQEMEEALKTCQKNGERVVFLDIPLYFEMTHPPKVDGVWVVYVPREKQVTRLMERNNLSKEEANRLINSQISVDEKAKRASAVIENDGSVADTYQQVDKLVKTL